jgi:hypothetical protein
MTSSPGLAVQRMTKSMMLLAGMTTTWFRSGVKPSLPAM